jgi:hypothetical protein
VQKLAISQAVMEARNLDFTRLVRFFRDDYLGENEQMKK